MYRSVILLLVAKREALASYVLQKVADLISRETLVHCLLWDGLKAILAIALADMTV